MISKIFKRKVKITQEEVVPVQEVKKESSYTDKKVFINYVPKDEAYVAPLKILLEEENISYVNSKQQLNECFIIINIMTSHFLEFFNDNVMKDSEKNGIRIINIIFDKNSTDLSGLVGEKVWVEAQQINDYILFPLLYHAPYNKHFAIKKNEVLEELRTILYGSIVPPRIYIESNATILFCGSFGYSMIRGIIEEKNYKISGKSYLLTKNKSVSKGQPEIGVETWCIDMDSAEETDTLKARIEDWLKENIVENKELIIVAGLGKSTSSLLVPLICSVARERGIKTSAICAFPFSFECSNARKVAETSYHIIKSMCTTFVYDDFYEKKDRTIQSNIGLGEYQKLLQIGFMKALELSVNCKKNTDIEDHRIVIRQKTGDCDHQRCAYGKYEIFIE